MRVTCVGFWNLEKRIHSAYRIIDVLFFHEKSDAFHYIDSGIAGLIRDAL